jgi:UDP-glucose 4-epimerase
MSEMSRRPPTMRCLVTGCAGFIGSHLCERLLQDSHSVVGIDNFTESYPRSYKEQNLVIARSLAHFTLYKGDIATLDLTPVLRDVDVIFHLAAQPGVRSSWGTDFELYTQRNVLATQRLLEAARHCRKLQRFVYASSSSVYGNAQTLPVAEASPTRPISPYGVTKLAGEHLCDVYHKNFGIPTVTLRYFTVYGARQRPDMAFHRFIRAAHLNEPIALYEDGRQTRDFTHVRDTVTATVAAALSPDAIGGTYNVAGGSRITLNEALSALGEILGTTVHVQRAPGQSGDVRNTYADITAAERDLGYRPAVDLRAGLRDEVTWYRHTFSALGAGAG